VDGVSSIGALPFEMDKWKVDIAVTGSQKALSLPTGLAVMAVSEKVCAFLGHHLDFCLICNVECRTI
jgi:alanine-glyoxylate transaminase / serine-glyoxylate transaminase / serine-pyruvate transaminase